MRPPRVSRRTGAPPARGASAPLLVLLALLAVPLGCGRDDASPDGAKAARPPPATAGGPLATYRRATTRFRDGETLTIEAVAPCRVTLQVVQGDLRDGERTHDLEPGETVKVMWSLAPEGPASGTPGAAAPLPGASREITHALQYGFDDQSMRSARLRARASTPAPWVRTVMASPPISPRPFPGDALALAAVGVADLASHAGLTLVVEPVPAIVGAPEGTPPSALQVAFLWMRLGPR